MPTNYYEASISEIVSRRLQRKQAGGTLANWPPQNALRQRPPTRGKYSSKQAPSKSYNMPKLPSRKYATLSAPSVSRAKTEVRPPSVTRFNFLRGI